MPKTLKLGSPLFIVTSFVIWILIGLLLILARSSARLVSVLRRPLLPVLLARPLLVLPTAILLILSTTVLLIAALLPLFILAVAALGVAPLPAWLLLLSFRIPSFPACFLQAL